jgi:hypothetical protein
LRLLNNPVAMGADIQNGIEVWETWAPSWRTSVSASPTSRRVLKLSSVFSALLSRISQTLAGRLSRGLCHCHGS